MKGLSGPLERCSCVFRLESGRKANSSERKAAMSAGQQFIKEKGYSAKTTVKP